MAASATQSPKQRAAPQRTCVGCRDVTAKRQLIRVVRTPAGGVALDPTGRANGRGAYVHEDASCWRSALAKDTLGRALKTSLAGSDRVALQAHAAALPEQPAPTARS